MQDHEQDQPRIFGTVDFLRQHGWQYLDHHIGENLPINTIDADGAWLLKQPDVNVDQAYKLGISLVLSVVPALCARQMIAAIDEVVDIAASHPTRTGRRGRRGRRPR